MASQYGTERVYSGVDGENASKKVMCDKCKVYVVPRGIASTRVDAVGEKHCPNCGHVLGRDNH